MIEQVPHNVLVAKEKQNTWSSLGKKTLIGRCERPGTSWSNTSGLSSHICQISEESHSASLADQPDLPFGESQPPDIYPHPPSFGYNPPLTSTRNMMLVSNPQQNFLFR
jgi:hypothetical protein